MDKLSGHSLQLSSFAKAVACQKCWHQPVWKTEEPLFGSHQGLFAKGCLPRDVGV